MHRDREPQSLANRVGKVLLFVFTVLLFGTIGYKALDQFGRPAPHRAWMECFYQTCVIVSTLGIEDAIGYKELPYGRQFTIVMILLGITTAGYAITTLTAFVVEGELSYLLGRHRMDKEIAKLSNHYIVCGAGRTGVHVIHELVRTSRQFVIIDFNEDHLRSLSFPDFSGKILYVVGDATDESILEKAGLRRAAGILATLEEDRDNLFLVVTVKQMNPSIKIIARGEDLSAADKLRRAGADSVIYPNFIGGLRMVSEMVRPVAVGFLDQMLRERDRQVRIEQVVVGQNGSVAGQTLGKSGIREKTGLLIVACRQNNEPFVYNPGPETVLNPGMALVVIGEVNHLVTLRQLVGES